MATELEGFINVTGGNVEAYALRLFKVKDSPADPIAQFEHFLRERTTDGPERVLILGAGKNRLAAQLEERLPEIACISFDYIYAHEDRDNIKSINTITDESLPEDRGIGPVSRTKYLVGGSWDVLPFANGSFSKVLSVSSFPTWVQFADEVCRTTAQVTRVAQPGALWGYIGPARQEFQDLFLRQLQAHGWQTDPDNLIPRMVGMHNNNYQTFAGASRLLV